MSEEGREQRVDLRVQTKNFALRIIRVFATLPKRPEAEVIVKQLLRCGTSVRANLREAWLAVRCRVVCKVGDCLKELEETCYWLESARECGAGRGRSAFSSPR